MTLEEIIEGCRRGNAEARRELYVRYGSPMYGVIRRYVSDASTAEDLLHDGFVTLYTRIGDYRGDGPFEGWCRRIFVNTVMSYFRRRNPLEGADEVSAANLRSSVPPTVLDELSAGEIKACVDTLPEGYRTIFRWVLSIPFFISCIRQQNPLTVLSKIILRKVKQFNLPPPKK